MKTIIFNSGGEQLKISFTFIGLIDASYTYSLWSPNTNTIIENNTGNNKNTQDDIFCLPVPLADNNGRIIQFSTSFIGTDPTNFKNYSIKAQIFQGSELIGEDEESGDVTGKAQDSLFFFQLKS